MRRPLIAALAAAGIFATTVAVNAVPPRHAPPPHPPAPAPPRHNPLIDEMKALDSAFSKIVSAVALEQRRPVLDAIDSLHGLEKETLRALRSGAIRLPRNEGRLDEFEKLDRDFHRVLGDLEMAARDSDSEKMLKTTKKLLEKCVDCHRRFR